MTALMAPKVAFLVSLARSSHESSRRVRGILPDVAEYQRGQRDAYLIAARSLHPQYGARLKNRVQAEIERVTG